MCIHTLANCEIITQTQSVPESGDLLHTENFVKKDNNYFQTHTYEVGDK